MDNARVKARTLSGFMELMPQDQLLFNKIASTLEEHYRLCGFLPLDTPILENSDVLLAKAGGETEKQIYRFTKGDSDLTMRFDLTVPLAKYVALHYNDLVFPFKRYQIGKVYRGERSQRGRFREFYQADIDIIGDGELAITNDAEIPSIIYGVFSALGLTDFTIRINNRKILFGLFLMLSIEEYAEEAMRIVDKIEKIGRDKAAGELRDMGIAAEKVELLLQFIAISGSSEEMLSQLRAFSRGEELFERGIHELECVVKAVSMFGVPEESYKIDLSIARGLDYYTGTVYETSFDKHPEIGSICSGGRYDNLAGHYTDKKLPGVGVSIGLTRLFFILNEMNYLNRQVSTPVDVLVLPMTESYEEAIAFASLLRTNHLNAQIYFEDKKFKNKMSYANRINVPFVAFIGEDEIKQRTVSLKNFISGVQVTVSREEALSVIRGSLEEIGDTKIINCT